MAVRKRGRRRIVVNNRLFLWWVQEDNDSPNLVLYVVSQDKQFLVQYYLGYPEETCHLIVIGKEFGGLTDIGGIWRRFRCPQWEASGAITPSSVRSLILWSLSMEEARIEVDWRGLAKLQP